MKTSVNIPDQLLREAMRRAGVTTKTEVILLALKELVRRREVEALLRNEGRVHCWTRKQWQEFRRGKSRSG
jgi:Arc/MetJ family transcription regulator